MEDALAMVHGQLHVGIRSPGKQWKMGSGNWNSRSIASLSKWILLFMYRPDEAMLFLRSVNGLVFRHWK